jgi:hypothetical protein
MTITTEQHDILRHSLGLGRSSREYRNHFVTGPGSTDYPHCEALVAAGLMRRYEGNPLTGGEPMYAVTDEGKTLARSKPPNAQAQAAPTAAQD